MFVIKADGKTVYNPSLFDEQYQVINPELTLEVNKAGSLSFTMPPGNAMWDSLNKLTSVITVEQDGKGIFYGRVMNDETDYYNQRYIYCEGEMAYLLDSIQRPYEFEGNAVDLFKQLIANHNECVGVEKQFTVGNITAVDENTDAAIDSSEHTDTFSEINTRLLNAYGGYIRIRHEDGARYIDYLSEAGENSSQPIQFGVNLLDLKNSISAEDIFTVLIPTGAMQKGEDGRYTELTKISSVNNGLDYLEDTEGVARYGRIWERKHWDAISDPEKLKEKGLEYLQTGIAEDATLTITAVDMHFVDTEKQVINIGDTVRILSEPHGMDRLDICYKIVAPLQEPERTEYTFGEPKRDLTDNVVANNDTTKSYGGGGGRSTKEEMQDVIRWAYAQADQEKATYDILTGEIDNLNGRTSSAEIRLNGVESTIALKADKSIVDEYGERLTQAEIDIDGAEAAIKLKADQSTVTEYGERLTQAEIDIDGAEAAIKLKADQSTVTEYGERLTQAEIDIDGAKGEIALKASKKEVDELGNTVDDLETTFTISSDGVRQAIQDGDKTIAELNSTVNGLEHWVTDADGNISTLTNAVRGMESKVTEADGKINELSNTVEGMRSMTVDQNEQITVLVKTANGIKEETHDIVTSAIWRDESHIRACIGTMYVDDNGMLHIVNGSGLMVDKGSASVGVYDEDNLTAGLLVEKLNNGTTSAKIKADRIVLDGYVTMDTFETEKSGFAAHFYSEMLETVELVAETSVRTDALHADIAEIGSSLTVNGAEVATQSWADNRYYTRTYCNANFATFTHLSTNYALKSALSDYQLAKGLTTKTITYVKDVSASTATTPPFYNANGTQVSAGLTYVKGVSYKTESVDVVVYA